MTYEPQVEWCRKNIPHFAASHDAAEKARQETEANRADMARYIKEQADER